MKYVYVEHWKVLKNLYVECWRYIYTVYVECSYAQDRA